MAVIAKRCPEVQVAVTDINPDRLAAWQSGSSPIYEPGLEGFVRHCQGPR